MSLFEDENVKKAIRAFVSLVEVAVKVLLPKDAVTQAPSAPYVAPKKPVNMAAALLCSLNSPVPKKAVGDSIQPVNNRMSRTELDSHANMPVMGRDTLVVSDTGRVME
eukprot:7864196-Ditylum_brightwellii.AAC.1